MNQRKQYRTIADLLTEESFVAWHLQKNETDEFTWEQWVAENECNAELANQARQVLGVLIGIKTQNVSCWQRNASFDRLLKKINSHSTVCFPE